MQFDVFVNPIAAARAAYPYVTVLQSDFAGSARDLIVGPLVPRDSLGAVRGRLTPVVRIEGADYVALIPALATVRRKDLQATVTSIAAARSELLAAIDLLFFGA